MKKFDFEWGEGCWCLRKRWKSQCGRHCGYRGEKNVSAIKQSGPSVLLIVQLTPAQPWDTFRPMPAACCKRVCGNQGSTASVRQEAAALRNFGPAYDRCGSFSSDRPAPGALGFAPIAS